MKILKPDALGLLHRSIHFARQNQLAIGMLAFFNFDKSSLSGLLPEAQMWPFVAKAMGKDAILDEGWAKANGEFLIFGNAYAPDGKPATELAVMAQVGSLKKSLFVRGDRHFNKLGAITAPTPFTRMAMSPQNAFGGPASLDNPLGKGLVDVQLPDGSSVLPLPNIENTSRLILREGERAAAEGFWPYPPASPQRTQHLGVFDQPWLQKTWPHLPEETRPAYFQVAPADQRLSGFFQGNEKIQINHMHLQQALMQAGLPNLRARCFVNRKLGGGEEFSEVTARAETVWLFPNQACGIVLYRAVVSTQDEDAEDVLHLMADWEDMQTAPLPFDHYHQAFLSQLPAKKAQAAQLNVPAPQASAALAEIVKPAETAFPVMAVAAAVSYPQLDAVKAEAAKLEAHTRQLMQQHGITDADIAPYLKHPEPTPPATLADVEKLAKDLEDQTRALMKQHNITDAQVAEHMLPPPPELKPGPDDLKNAVKQLNALTDDAMKKHGITKQDIQKYADSKPEMADFAASLKQPPQDIDQAFAGLSAALAAAAKPPAIELPKLDLPKLDLPKIDLKMPEAKPAKRLTREDVVARHSGGQSLAGLDLAALDLSKLDLSGADFSQSLLQGTNFEASDLSRAKLASASAGAAIFKAAKMAGSDMSRADFTGADFSKANLGQAHLSHAIFDGAKMPGLLAAGCTAQKTSFADCDLSAADFSNAELTAAVFNGAKLGKTSFKASRSDNAEFYGADASQAMFSNASLRASRADAASQFAGAQFASAQLGRANWEGAAMAGAGFEHANLDNADFSRVRAGGAKFNATSAKGCKFDKADLSGADLSATNLFKGSLRKTKVANALLRRANLYGVDFYGTTPTLAALEGANIDQTLLAARKPVV